MILLHSTRWQFIMQNESSRWDWRKVKWSAELILKWNKQQNKRDNNISQTDRRTLLTAKCNWHLGIRLNGIRPNACTILDYTQWTASRAVMASVAEPLKSKPILTNPSAYQACASIHAYPCIQPPALTSINLHSQSLKSNVRSDRPLYMRKLYALLLIHLIDSFHPHWTHHQFIGVRLPIPEFPVFDETCETDKKQSNQYLSSLTCELRDFIDFLMSISINISSFI